MYSAYMVDTLLVVEWNIYSCVFILEILHSVPLWSAEVDVWLALKTHTDYHPFAFFLSLFHG